MGAKRDLNTVAMVGRLTRDGELTYTSGGTAVSEFTIAVHAVRKRGSDWEEQVSFFPVSLFGKPAESLSPYLKKVTQVGIRGELQQQRWVYEGRQMSKVVILAQELQLLSRPQNSAVTTAPSPRPSFQPPPVKSGELAHEPASETTGYTGPEFFEDDIPF
jgi:single-strand DNA-binding protein